VFETELSEAISRIPLKNKKNGILSKMQGKRIEHG